MDVDNDGEKRAMATLNGLLDSIGTELRPLALLVMTADASLCSL